MTGGWRDFLFGIRAREAQPEREVVHRFDPQPDITPFEVACILRGSVPGLWRVPLTVRQVEDVKQAGVYRHFKPLEDHS